MGIRRPHRVRTSEIGPQRTSSNLDAKSASGAKADIASARSCRAGDDHTVAFSARRAKHLPVLLKKRANCPALPAKIFIFPKYENYEITNSARLDTGDVMAIRHQT